jgi:hypothetical protein
MDNAHEIKRCLNMLETTDDRLDKALIWAQIVAIIKRVKIECWKCDCTGIATEFNHATGLNVDILCPECLGKREILILGENNG